MLCADVMLCWCITLGHLDLLYYSSINKVVSFGPAVQGVAPVGSVQLVKLLWLFVMLVHFAPGVQDVLPLL